MGRGPGRPRKASLPLEELLTPQPPTDAEMTAEFEYQDFLGSLGDGNVSVTIHRYPKFGNLLEWCDNGTLGDATLEQIRERHGPGKYRLAFRGPSGMLGTKNICISQQFKVADNNGNGHAAAQDTFLQQQLVMQQNMLVAMISSLKGPDMGAMMAGLAAIMSAMKADSKAIDPIQMVQSITSIYQGIKDKNEKTPLEQIRDVASVIKEFSSDTKGAEIESGWGALAEVGKEAVNRFGPALAGFAPQPSTAAPNRVPAVVTVQQGPPAPLLQPVARSAGGVPVVPTAPAASVPTTTTEEVEANLEKWIRAEVAMLKRKALRPNSDPGFWSDYILFESPEEPGSQAVAYAVRHGASFEDLLAFDSEITDNPHLNSWFRTLYDGLQSELQSEFQRPLDSAGQGGNAGNVAPDGATRPAGQPASSGLPDGTVIPKSSGH